MESVEEEILSDLQVTLKKEPVNDFIMGNVKCVEGHMPKNCGTDKGENWLKKIQIQKWIFRNICFISH